MRKIRGVYRILKIGRVAVFWCLVFFSVSTYNGYLKATQYSKSIVAIKDMLVRDNNQLEKRNTLLLKNAKDMERKYRSDLKAIEDNLIYLSGISYLKKLVFSSADETLASIYIILEQEKDKLPIGNPFGGANTHFLTAKWGESVLEGRLRTHKGNDIKNATGDGTLYPVKEGVIEDIGDSRIYGKWILINHGNGYYTKYSHLRSIYYIDGKHPVGQEVTTETEIGMIGSTGLSTGTHLHYEVLAEDPFTGELKQINPEPYIFEFRIKEYI